MNEDAKMTEVEKRGIGKAKVGLVVCAILVVILAISSVWLYTRIDSLNLEYDDYVANHHSTDEEVEDFIAEVEDYADEVENLISEMEDYVANHRFTNQGGGTMVTQILSSRVCPQQQPVHFLMLPVGSGFQLTLTYPYLILMVG